MHFVAKPKPRQRAALHSNDLDLARQVSCSVGDTDTPVESDAGHNTSDKDATV